MCPSKANAFRDARLADAMSEHAGGGRILPYPRAMVYCRPLAIPWQETSQAVSGQHRSCPLMAVGPDGFTGKRLDSWKEIAAFFGRAERTVKRWEAERGLPVHRLPGSGRRAVFAYRDEVADWLKAPGRELESDEPISTDSPADRHSKSLVLKIQSKLPAGNVAPVSKSLITSRINAWLLPLALVVSVIVFVGPGAVHYKASASRHAPSAEAQDLYLEGRYFWNRRTPDDLNKAVDYFTQAIVQDPGDAQAYVGLADCYNLLREFGAMPPREAYPRALAAAQRAVGLDAASAEAHNSLAFVTYWWLWGESPPNGNLNVPSS
jgi:hypothetical protein